MMTVASLLSLGACLAAVYYLLMPLLNKTNGSLGTTKLFQVGNDKEDQSRRCLQVLQDLEFDYQTGKIRQHDYQESRARLERELLTIAAKPSIESPS